MAFSRTPEALVVPPRGRPLGRVGSPVHGLGMLGVIGTALCVVLATSACQDAPIDPLVGVVAGESEGALAVGVKLPDPEWLAPAEGLSIEATRAVETWQGSWSMEPEAGHAARVSIYGPLAHALAPTLAPGRLQEALVQLGEGVRHAGSIASEDLTPRLEQRVWQAKRARAEAADALDRGDTVRAVEATLRGGDALREVGPEAVARTLQREVEEAFGRVSEGGSYSEKDMERLTRLVHGAREALDEGSWVLAIRRAYYARALLRGND